MKLKGKKEDKDFNNIDRLYESFAYDKIESKVMLIGAKYKFGILQSSVAIKLETQSISDAAKQLIDPLYFARRVKSIIIQKDKLPLSIKEAVDKLLKNQGDGNECPQTLLETSLKQLKTLLEADKAVAKFIEDLCEELGKRPEVREQTLKPDQSIFEWILEFLVKLFMGQSFDSKERKRTEIPLIELVKDLQGQCYPSLTQAIKTDKKPVLGKYTRDFVEEKTNKEQITNIPI